VPRKKRCKVFISYSRHDEALVRPLAQFAGVAVDDAVFFDVTSLAPGDRWRDEIMRAIKDAEVFVVCWCCEARGSSFIAEEIAAALQDRQKRLVPVRLCDTPLPTDLEDSQWIDFRTKMVHACPHSNAALHAKESPASTMAVYSRLMRVVAFLWWPIWRSCRALMGLRGWLRLLVLAVVVQAFNFVLAILLAPFGPQFVVIPIFLSIVFLLILWLLAILVALGALKIAWKMLLTLRLESRIRSYFVNLVAR